MKQETLKAALKKRPVPLLTLLAMLFMIKGASMVAGILSMIVLFKVTKRVTSVEFAQAARLKQRRAYFGITRELLHEERSWILKIDDRLQDWLNSGASPHLVQKTEERMWDLLAKADARIELKNLYTAIPEPNVQKQKTWTEMGLDQAWKKEAELHHASQKEMESMVWT